MEEDMPVYIYFCPDPEDVEDDLIDDYPGNYNEEDVNGKCFFSTAAEVCRTHFIRAYKNLSPLFGDRHFQSLAVCIDLIGLFDAQACYFFELSDENKGEYHFSASPSALHAYLKNHWDSNCTLPTFYQNLWEHELIHMLDHKHSGYKFSMESTNFKEFWIEYLLSFRTEGVAELYDLMKGHNPVKNMDAARRKFRAEILKLIVQQRYNPENVELTKKQVRQTFLYYSIGQWMILHALSCTDNTELKSLLHKVSLQINKSQVVNEQDMFLIIKYALELDAHQFIQNLTKPGLDGDVFITPTYLNEIPKRIIEYSNNGDDFRSDETDSRDDVILVGMFDRFWPGNSLHSSSSKVR